MSKKTREDLIAIAHPDIDACVKDLVKKAAIFDRVWGGSVLGWTDTVDAARELVFASRRLEFTLRSVSRKRAPKAKGR